MNYYADSAEWKYLFRNAMDWDTILPLYHLEQFKNKEEALEYFEELLTSTGQWTAQTLAARSRELDAVGSGTLSGYQFVPSAPMAKTMQEVKEMGLSGVTADSKYGGIGSPCSLGMLIFQQICRACLSTSGQLAFTGAFADMLDRFASPSLASEFIPLICSGELSGSMCITEPGAGSDVGSLRTTAEKQGDGTYLINGSKCFITSAGGGSALILARMKGAPQGLAGLSLFFALERGKGNKLNYQLTKLEDKLGMNGSPTCEVVYEDTVAQIIGGENQGFKMMLHLMNEARISVGLQGVGIMEAALHYVRQYAETRVQFGKPLLELPLFRRNLEEWETERDGFRAFMVDTISHFDIFQRLDLKKRHTGDLNEAEAALMKRTLKTVRRRTPLAKYYGSETATRLSLKSIQALGGYGYMKDYDVERFHRDAIGSLLYEGTSQIQSLMAMKDFVKTMMDNPAKFLQTLVGAHPLSGLLGDSELKRDMRAVNYEFRKNVAALCIRCFKPGLTPSEGNLRETLDQLRKVFKKEYWQESERFDRLMLHAEGLCAALSYIEVLKVLYAHAAKDPQREGLYKRYLRLVRPRLVAIYEDWK